MLELYTITSVLLLLLLFVLAYLYLTHRPKNCPPGPKVALPFVGNLLEIGQGDIRVSLARLRKKYGDVYSLYFGSTLAFVICGYGNLKEAYVKNGDVLSDRPGSKKDSEYGLVATNGEKWQLHRKFAISSLRQFGVFGSKNVMDERIQTEVSLLIDEIQSYKGSPFDITLLVCTSTANVICSLVFGGHFKHGDERFCRMLRTIQENFKLIKVAGSMGIPFLRYLPPYRAQFKKIMENRETLKSLLTEITEDHLRDLDENNVTDYAGLYLKEMRKRRKDGDQESFPMEQLRREIGDLFVAGTESSATGIRWMIVYFLNYPDLQKRIFAEIEENIGLERLPSLSDRTKLPFTESAIMEMLRHANIASIGAIRGTTRDFHFQGYTLPKRCMVIPFLDSALRDETVWKDPDDFTPDRFLDSDGKCTQPEQFIPFSFGKRFCFGEPLARMELFLFISSLVQRFEFLLPENEPMPSFVGTFGLVHAPDKFTVRAVLRH